MLAASANGFSWYTPDREAAFGYAPAATAALTVKTKFTSGILLPETGVAWFRSAFSVTAVVSGSSLLIYTPPAVSTQLWQRYALAHISARWEICTASHPRGQQTEGAA